MKKSHRAALKPPLAEESRFLQHAGYARSAYNWAVGEFQAGLEVGEWLPERSLRRRWNAAKGFIILPGKEAALPRSGRQSIIWSLHQTGPFVKAKTNETSGEPRLASPPALPVSWAVP